MWTGICIYGRLLLLKWNKTNLILNPGEIHLQINRGNNGKNITYN